MAMLRPDRETPLVAVKPEDVGSEPALADRVPRPSSLEPTPLKLLPEVRSRVMVLAAPPLEPTWKTPL